MVFLFESEKKYRANFLCWPSFYTLHYFRALHWFNSYICTLYLLLSSHKSKINPIINTRTAQSLNSSPLANYTMKKGGKIVETTLPYVVSKVILTYYSRQFKIYTQQSTPCRRKHFLKMWHQVTLGKRSDAKDSRSYYQPLPCKLGSWFDTINILGSWR